MAEKADVTTLVVPSRAFVLRIGSLRSMLLVTAIVVVTSAGITQLLLLPLQPISERLFWATLVISVAAPLLVSPPMFWLVNGLLRQAESGREQAERLATTDALTGVMNRRRFFALGESELARAIAQQGGAALLLLDIDHFKAVNDTHGHAAGDRVLQAVAEACAHQLRPYDLFARLGGEEFAILLGGLDEVQALQAAERVRAAVAALAIAIDASVEVRPTVSVGVGLAGVDGDSLAGLLDAADRAMYAAKRGGRDRVCRAARQEA